MVGVRNAVPGVEIPRVGACCKNLLNPLASGGGWTHLYWKAVELSEGLVRGAACGGARWVNLVCP